MFLFACISLLPVFGTVRTFSIAEIHAFNPTSRKFVAGLPSVEENPLFADVSAVYDEGSIGQLILMPEEEKIRVLEDQASSLPEIGERFGGYGDLEVQESILPAIKEMSGDLEVQESRLPEEQVLDKGMEGPLLFRFARLGVQPVAADDSDDLPLTPPVEDVGEPGELGSPALLAVPEPQAAHLHRTRLQQQQHQHLDGSEHGQRRKSNLNLPIRGMVKRSPACFFKCLKLQLIHPAQCQSIC